MCAVRVQRRLSLSFSPPPQSMILRDCTMPDRFVLRITSERTVECAYVLLAAVRHVDSWQTRAPIQRLRLGSGRQNAFVSRLIPLRSKCRPFLSLSRRNCVPFPSNSSNHSLFLSVLFCRRVCVRRTHTHMRTRSKQRARRATERDDTKAHSLVGRRTARDQFIRRPFAHTTDKHRRVK